jgi:outer membrane protein TolC
MLRFALGVVGAVAAWGGGGASAQTLSEALSYAYNNNPQLLAQRATLRATDEQVPQALANWRPTVNFTGQAGYERGAVSQNGNPSIFSSFVERTLDLKVTQPLYRGGRTEAQTRQAINTVEAARAQTLATETTVFQAVCQAFLDVVRDQTLVEVNRSNEAVLKKQLDATRDRFKVGEVTRTDVAQAESSYAQAQATRITSQGQLEVSRAAYARVVGHPPGRLVMPRERPALPATREEALGLAANNNFNVIAGGFTELAAKDNVDLIRGQLLPQVSIVAQVTVPLYEGGQIYSQTRAAEQAVGARRSQVDDARRQAVQVASQAWDTLTSARASIASFSIAVRAAQIALAGVQQEVLVGSRTVLDVLNTEQQLFNTQQQLVTADHDAAVAEFNLAAATGRLIAPELHLPVQLYDMEKHYQAVKGKWAGFKGGLSE